MNEVLPQNMPKLKIEFSWEAIQARSLELGHPRQRLKTLLNRQQTSKAIKSGVKISTHNCGDCRINPRRNQLKKLVSCRIAIGGIQGDYTKQFAMEAEFTQHKTTSIIKRRIDKGQTRTKKDDTTTRLLRTRRRNRVKARRTKPGLTLNITNTVSQTYKIDDRRLEAALPSRPR